MMKTIITSTDWRGVPCTMRYASGKPVCEGDIVGESIITGGAAPHKQGSTGYVHTDRGQYYVGTVDAHWVPEYEPHNWAVYVARKPRGKKEPEWQIHWWVDYNEPLGYLAAHGAARLMEDSVTLTKVVAVDWK